MSLPNETAVAPVSGWLNRHAAPHVLTLVLIAGIGALNMNIFLPSLPSMAAYFQTDYAVVQLAVSAYLGITGLLQLIIGPLSDRYGRRAVMLGSLAIFLFATVGCILSTDITTFLIFRMTQATVASGIVLSRAIVRDLYSPEKAAPMIGYVTMGMAVVPMIGPAMGGLLDAAFGWRAPFLATLVFGLLVAWLVWADLGETNKNQSASFNAQFKAYPELLTSRRFWGYALVAAFTSGSFFAFIGGAPFVSTEVFDIPSKYFGFYFSMVAMGYMIGNFVSARRTERVGLNRMMLFGTLLSCTALTSSMALFAVGVFHPMAFFSAVLLVGLGNGMVLPSANVGMVSVRPHLAGSASGLGGALMIGGGAGIAAITGTVMTKEAGVWPLLGMMLLSAMLSLVMAFYVIHVARKVALAQQGGQTNTTA